MKTRAPWTSLLATGRTSTLPRPFSEAAIEASLRERVIPPGRRVKRLPTLRARPLDQPTAVEHRGNGRRERYTGKKGNHRACNNARAAHLRKEDGQCHAGDKCQERQVRPPTKTAILLPAGLILCGLVGVGGCRVSHDQPHVVRRTLATRTRLAAPPIMLVDRLPPRLAGVINVLPSESCPRSAAGVPVFVREWRPAPAQHRGSTAKRDSMKMKPLDTYLQDLVRCTRVFGGRTLMAVHSHLHGRVRSVGSSPWIRMCNVKPIALKSRFRPR